jgi:hypothetical protein
MDGFPLLRGLPHYAGNDLRGAEFFLFFYLLPFASGRKERAARDGKREEPLLFPNGCERVAALSTLTLHLH